ncbi:MAG: MotA/TolQ/ExbB proton channel family protein, partial [Pseudomonadota bacterium]
MKKQIPIEFLYQVFALVVAVIVVHGMYTLVVRPKAEASLAQQQVLLEEDPNYVPERNVYVLVKDFEQEACFILMIWAIAIMAYKAVG